MGRHGLCPHPKSKRWPLVDDGGSRCPCGCAWEPFLFITRANMGAHYARDQMVLEVYRCKDRRGRPLDHWHTIDALQRDGRRPRRQPWVDEPVSSTLLSSPDIQRRTWSGHRRARPIGHTERRRLRRHRR